MNRLPPFLLDQWLTTYEGRVDFDLATSTGPRVTLQELLALATPDQLAALHARSVSYSTPQGGERLREAIAARTGADAEHVLVVTGASEALHIIFADAAATGGNIVVPDLAFSPILEMPAALGISARRYRLDAANAFRPDFDEIGSLIDGRTRLVLVNSPHNPTGATLSLAETAALRDRCANAGVQLVFDEVYWPLYFDAPSYSAAAIDGVTAVGSLSKSFCLSGLRVGWIVEPDRARLDRYINQRMYFTISCGSVAESLAEIAVTSSERLLTDARRLALANRATLSEFVARHTELLSWVPPAGGTMAFPQLNGVADSRPFCTAAAGAGVLFAPGDCFERPSHFRVGFGQSTRFGDALARVEETIAALR